MQTELSIGYFVIFFAAAALKRLGSTPIGQAGLSHITAFNCPSEGTIPTSFTSNYHLTQVFQNPN